MAEPRVYHILCVGDSRLARMQPLLNENMRNIKFSCYVFPGASLGRVAYELRLILDKTHANHFDYIAVIAGICDITCLERYPTYRVRPNYPTVESTVDNFERLCSLFRSTVRLFTDIPIFYATVPGIHMNFYSRSDSADLFQLQSVVDCSIPLINIIVKRVNMLNRLPTLDIAKYIHRSRGHQGKYRTRYCLLYDGCHPNEYMRNEWAAKILKVEIYKCGSLPY